MQQEVQLIEGSVTKRIIKAGLGQKPKKRDTVSVHYDAYLVDGNTKFDSSRDRKASYEFPLSKGKVINAWEVAIPTMTVGEVAEIVCTSDYGYGDKGFHPIVPPKASLRYEVELLGTWEPAGSALQRIEAAGIKKDEGNDLYKKSAFEQALYAYKKGRDYVIELWDCEPEELEQCRELVIALQLNISACYLKLREFDNAVEVANNVLQRDPSNVKAYYRIGQAYLEKAEFEKGIEYLETGVKMTSDPDLKNMLATLKHKQDTWFRNSKSVFRKMVS